MSIHRHLHRVTILAAVTLAAGCAPDTQGLLSPPMHQVRSAANVVLTTPARRLNSTRYREGYRHGSNRSGSASLTARALLGRDGRTVLELTTGFLGVPWAPGTIDKLQVKMFNPDGALEDVVNDTSTTPGARTITYMARARHSTFQLQANIKGIDGNRTDVVSVIERVNLRPDIAVQQLQVAERVPAGVPVNISAVVAERNGDLGATITCVLEVNGQAVDRADGVWIAAGDAATCAFSHVFPVAGPQSLRVRAQQVNPGDYDTNNNAIERYVTVEGETVIRMWGQMYSYGETHDQRSVWTSITTNTTTGRSVTSVQTTANRAERQGSGYAARGEYQRAAGPMVRATASLQSIASGRAAEFSVQPTEATCHEQFTAAGFFKACLFYEYVWVEGWQNSNRWVYFSSNLVDERDAAGNQLYYYADLQESSYDGQAGFIDPSQGIRVAVRIETESEQVFVVNDSLDAPTIQNQWTESGYENCWFASAPSTTTRTCNRTDRGYLSKGAFKLLF